MKKYMCDRCGKAINKFDKSKLTVRTWDDPQTKIKYHLCPKCLEKTFVVLDGEDGE